MITYLKTAFIKLIGETDWMDPLTKMIARGKVNAMIALVGYPDWIKNKQFIESYYDGVSRFIILQFWIVNNLTIDVPFRLLCQKLTISPMLTISALY